MKQYSAACERNREPILEVLRTVLKDSRTVLEIGSGSGEHAVWFSQDLPHLDWQPSDQPGMLGSVSAWRDEEGGENLLPPVEIDLLDESTWPQQTFDALVCINTIHIVSWPGVEALFRLAEKVLPESGRMFVYGPYRYVDRPLEPSNEQFDRWLKQRDPESGVRDFEAVNQLARQAGLKLMEDIAMPANNRSIWWRK